MSTDQPSEEELRAAYEAEIKKIRVEQILLEQIVSLVNLGMRRTGLAPGTEDERDVGQVRVAIEAVRALLPVVEESAGPQAAAIRDALSQLQLAFVRLGGSPDSVSAPGGPAGEPTDQPSDQPPAARPQGAPAPEGTPPEGSPDPEAKPGEAGPAQRSGRLWVPGQ
jgi:hypothetical protein